MIKLRIHYLVPGGVRCGRQWWYNATAKPADVTCLSCKTLMKKELQS